ncbi:MAG: hypothetical protein EPN20_10055 [Magnetospirillum sp.]|nr:MAG: hypothetical protein EPN20_10055 [Magnetospirillum sp.]
MTGISRVATVAAFTVASVYAIELTSLAVRYLWVDREERRLVDERADKLRQRHLDRFEAMGRVVDRRPLSEVLKEADAAGRPTIPFTPVFDAYRTSSRKILPLGGVSNTHTVTGNYNGFWSIVRHDEHGLNNDPDAWKDKVDYVIFGISVVYGTDINRPENFVQTLRDGHGVKILNFGYATAQVPDAYRAQIREFFPLITPPKAVLWTAVDGLQGMYVHSTGKSAGQVMRSEVLDKYADPSYSQSLATRQPEVDAATWAAFAESRDESFSAMTIGAEKSHLRDVLFLRNLRTVIRLVKGWSVVPPSSSLDDDLRQSPSAAETACHEAVMAHDLDVLNKTAAELKEKYNTKVIVLYLAVRDRVDGHYKGNDFCYNSYLDSVKKAGYDVIDLPKIIADRHIAVDDLYEFNSSGHYSRNGHAIVADILAKELDRIGY